MNENKIEIHTILYKTNSFLARAQNIFLPIKNKKLFVFYQNNGAANSTVLLFNPNFSFNGKFLIFNRFTIHII